MFYMVDNKIHVPRFKVKFTVGDIPREEFFRDKESCDAYASSLAEQNREALNRKAYHWIDTEEEFAVIMFEDPSRQAVMHHADIKHGEWKTYTFQLGNANYGSDTLLIKYGSITRGNELKAAIRKVKAYATGSPGSAIEYDAASPTDVLPFGEPVADDQFAPENGILFSSKFWAVPVKTDTGLIPAGTNEITVEVEALIDGFPEIKTAAPPKEIFAGIAVEGIADEGIDWADGEEVGNFKEASELLEKHRGRWKSREEWLAFKGYEKQVEAIDAQMLELNRRQERSCGEIVAALAANEGPPAESLVHHLQREGQLNELRSRRKQITEMENNLHG